MKSLLFLMNAVMAGFFCLSMAACSVDYDGNDDSNEDLIGTWDVVCEQYYVDNEGYSQPGRVDGFWVVTARTISAYQQTNATTCTTAGYTLDGRKLNIEGREACEVVALTREQMLLRKQVKQGVFQEVTFKRR